MARLNHHACLALWCGDNELIGALTWFPESRKDRDRYLVSYDRLNRTIETALHAVSPEANWWPSSPSPGPLSFGDAWHDDSVGRHAFLVGLARGPRLRPLPRRKPPLLFRIRLPVLSVDGGDPPLRRPAGLQHRRPGDRKPPEERGRQRPHRRDHVPLLPLSRWTFEDFVYLSQVQQGLAIKTAVTHWRSLKPHCMGTLYWQLNDTWPVCSWSSLDHGGNWKLLHHMSRQLLRPRPRQRRPRPAGDRPSRRERHAAARRDHPHRHRRPRWTAPPASLPAPPSPSPRTPR